MTNMNVQFGVPSAYQLPTNSQVDPHDCSDVTMLKNAFKRIIPETGLDLEVIESSQNLRDILNCFPGSSATCVITDATVDRCEVKDIRR